MTHDVPPPSRLLPGLPTPLNDLVVRATRRDPRARPADAGEFLSELRAAQDALPAGPAPASAPTVEDRTGAAETAATPTEEAGHADATIALTRLARTRRRNARRRARLLLAGLGCLTVVPAMALTLALAPTQQDPSRSGVDQTAPATPEASSPATRGGHPSRSDPGAQAPRRWPPSAAPAHRPPAPAPTKSERPPRTGAPPSCPPGFGDEWWYDYCR